MKKIIAIVGFVGIFASGAFTASAAYFNNTPVVPCGPQITNTLQLGSDNSQVYALQTMLANAGFLNTTPNGHFGYQTKYAVQAFQMNNGILVSGIVGPATRNVINESCGDTSVPYQSDDYSYDSYGYSNGVTIVGQNDPFVRVITPPAQNPTVYATPQSTSFTQAAPAYQINGQTDGNGIYIASTPVSTSIVGTPINNLNSSSQIASTNIVYNPGIGYGYGITPTSGSVTVTSPIANSVYNEGDSVQVNWGTNNIQTAPYSILLESTITGQSKVVAVVSGTSYSFVLTKELLDSVCTGSCNNQQGSYRVVVTMPTTDIAGNTSTLRAAIAPITIHRPLSNAVVTISSSKTPVNSGEIFKLYVNVPTNIYNNAYNFTNNSASYSVKLKAVCPSSVSASIAGVLCGQEFTVPATVINTQQEIPVIITNNTWYKQDVAFQVTVLNLSGQTIGSAITTVTANAAPFSF
jgi:peptidoglycan hydrolase-like protein with peptidoglycan-binding domain